MGLSDPQVKIILPPALAGAAQQPHTGAAPAPHSGTFPFQTFLPTFSRVFGTLLLLQAPQEQKLLIKH